MSASVRRYIREKENFEFSRGFTPAETEANELRKNFVLKHIVSFDTKTDVERDWAYIAKREYNYNVVLTGLANSFFVSNLALIGKIYASKKFSFWPIPVFTTLSYLYFQPQLLLKHNKKLFDMCNVGEEYYLGKKRNEVLRECNRILDREDF